MWEPLITDYKTKEIISSKIDEITQAINTHAKDVNNISVILGETGFSLYYAYLDKFNGANKNLDRIESHLTNIYEAINSGYRDTTLSSGLSGVIWTLNHLKKAEIIDDTENYQEIIDWLFISMKHSCQTAYFDYLHGAVGVGKATSEFYPYLKTDFFEDLLTKLEEFGIKDNDTIAWESYLHLNHEAYLVYNLGLPHGISGIIIFLAQLSEKQPNNTKLSSLLNSAINFLLQCKHDDQNSSTCLYPGYIYNKNKTGQRLAWCYGDLCVAVALLKSSKTLNRVDLRTEAMNIMRHSAKRRDLHDVKINDAGFCHGAAGVAHIFNRFYQETKNVEYKDAALFWIDQTLKMATFDNGFAGFKKFGYSDGWQNSLGILEGVAGIGLVFMSTIAPVEPKWDEYFLLS